MVSEIRPLPGRDQAPRGRAREARVQQEQVLVAERAAQKASIEGQLAERQRLLASIKDQIAKIKADEAERQRGCRSRPQQVVDQQQRSVRQLHAGRRRCVGQLSAACHARRRRRDRDELPRRPVRLGRGVAERLRLLRASSMYVYAQVGISLPHNAAMQYGYGSPVCRDQLQPGDLVFFDGLGHVGIYIGGGSVHPRAAHRRRREDLEPLGFVVRVDVRRRPPSCRSE